MDRLLERALNIFERVWPLIRGAPHNRLAWLVVLAGTLVIAGPVWEPLLRALAAKILGVDIELPPHPAWGLALVFLGLLYHLLAYRADGLRQEMQIARSRQHDADLIRAFQSDFREDRLDDVISRLESDHSIYSEDHTFLMNAALRLRSSDFHLLNLSLRGTAQELLSALSSLNSFIAREFFVPAFATSSNRSCLRPDWNIDRSGHTPPTPEEESKYDVLVGDLAEHTRDVIAAYRKMFRVAHEAVL